MNSRSSPPIAPLRDFSDRLSPMVVKELRHGLRTRFFTAALICFHWLLIMLMASTLVGVSTDRMNELFWTLALVSMLGVLPLRGFTALSSEMTGGTLDMLTLTSMSSFRIVIGKWASLFSQSLLLACSLLPYLIARYNFGGVEVVREVVALLILLLGSALATAAFVAFSSQTARALRGLLMMALAAGLFPLGVFVFVFVRESEGDGMIRSFFSLPLSQRIALPAGILGIVVYGVYFFLAMGASCIAPASENHSTRKRIVAFWVLLALTVIGFLLAQTIHVDAALWAFVPLMVLTILNGMDVLTETLPRIPTVVLPFVRRGRGATLFGNLLYPGWSSGVFFYLLLAAMPMSLIVWMASVTTTHNPEKSSVFVIACFLLAPLVPVSLRVNRKDFFVNWWSVIMIQVVAGILMSIFCGVSGSQELAGVGVLTPVTALFAAIIDYRHNEEMVSAGAGIGLAWAAIAIALAVRQFPWMRGLEKEAAMLLRGKKTPPPPDA